MSQKLRYERGSDEFSRVVAFTDGVFAIAMTLLVVQIEIPDVDPDDLGAAVADQGALIISLFISFLVIGYYWMAHHRFWALLARVEPGLMLLNLVYLSAIAFLPYPTGLVGKYESRPLSVMIYAAALAAASFMEVAMTSRAHHIGAFRKDPSPEAFRYALVASLSPVAIFALSIRSPCTAARLPCSSGWSTSPPNGCSAASSRRKASTRSSGDERGQSSSAACNAATTSSGMLVGGAAP